MKRRIVLTVLLALVGVMFGAGAANASTAPVPDNPLANGGYSAFSPVPDPLPNPNDAFDPNDLLSHYGTAGPTWHYYDLNPLEEVGASLWVEVTNDAMGLPKLAISAVGSLATWVFNPTAFLDNLNKPTDASAKALHDNLAAPWLPIVLLIVAIAIGWGARTGRLGMAFTRVLFALIGLGLVGLAVASPSSLAGKLSSVVTDTVSSVLVEQSVDENVKSDADAAAAAQQRANIGAKMVGPLWRVAVYDPWVMGTYGSPTSKTATDPDMGAMPLFKAQALTWNEAVAVDGKKAETGALVKQNQDDWAAVAKKVDAGDPVAYKYLQGSNPSLAPVLVSYVVTAAVLPFLTVALLMVLAGYLALFILAALLPLIGLAVIIHPPALAKVGRFLASILVNTVVFAAASVVVLKLTNALLGTGNVLFSTLVIAVASWVAWKFLKSFRGFKPINASVAGSTAAVSESVSTVKKKTKQVTKTATKKATKKHDGPVTTVDAGERPAGIASEAPAGARPSTRPVGTQTAVYVPERGQSTNGVQSVNGATRTAVEPAAVYVPGESAAPVKAPDMPTEATPVKHAPEEHVSAPAAAASNDHTARTARPGAADPYVPVKTRPEGEPAPVEAPAEIPGARRTAPTIHRDVYVPAKVAVFEDEEGVA